VVLLHNCFGIQPYVDEYARWFATLGYAALVVDSFGPRGARFGCDGQGAPNVLARAQDAFGALAYLRARPDVDPAHVALVGWSHGGLSAFVAGSRKITADFGGGASFRAVVLLYPSCNSPVRAISAPYLILQGARDDLAPPGVCEGWVRSMGADPPIAIHTYPGATHAFDNPTFRSQYVANVEHIVTFDAAATRDAHERIRAFLEPLLR
jgi:dienelactone hydrolase